MRWRKLIAGSLIVVALALPGVFPGAVEASHVCDPYPLDRCGEYQRERVWYCFYRNPSPSGPVFVATDPHVITVGGDPPVSIDSPQGGKAYVRMTPVDAFAADPWNAPLPKQVLWLEENNVPGLQPREFRCTFLVWFAECEPAQWMGVENWKNDTRYPRFPPDKFVV